MVIYGWSTNKQNTCDDHICIFYEFILKLITNIVRWHEPWNMKICHHKFMVAEFEYLKKRKKTCGIEILNLFLCQKKHKVLRENMKEKRHFPCCQKKIDKNFFLPYSCRSRHFKYFLLNGVLSMNKLMVFFQVPWVLTVKKCESFFFNETIFFAKIAAWDTSQTCFTAAVAK